MSPSTCRPKISGFPDAGAVQVIYSEGGVLSGRDRLWHQGDRGILSSPETGGDFGATLTVGDLDADGIDDLAVGSSRNSASGPPRRVRCTSIYGTGSGLNAARDQLLDQRTLAGGREDADFLGLSVTAADGDGAADLAVGVPGESLAGKRDGGMVSVVSASPGCCLTARDDVWHQDQGGAVGGIENGRHVRDRGRRLAVTTRPRPVSAPASPPGGADVTGRCGSGWPRTRRR